MNNPPFSRARVLRHRFLFQSISFVLLLAALTFCVLVALQSDLSGRFDRLMALKATDNAGREFLAAGMAQARQNFENAGVESAFHCFLGAMGLAAASVLALFLGRAGSDRRSRRRYLVLFAASTLAVALISFVIWYGYSSDIDSQNRGEITGRMVSSLGTLALDNGGIDVADLKQFEIRVKSWELVEAVRIFNEGDTVLYSWDSGTDTRSHAWKPVFERVKVPGSDLHFEVEWKDAGLASRSKEILLDLATLIVAVLLIAAQVAKLQRQYYAPKLDITNTARQKESLLESWSFFFYLSAFMSISFVPMQLQKTLFSEFSGALFLPTDALVGLPMLSWLIGIAAAGPLISTLARTLGVSQLYKIASSFVIVGNVLFAETNQFTLAIAARFIAGVGLGIAVIAGLNLVRQCAANGSFISANRVLKTSSAAGIVAALAIGGVLATHFSTRFSLYLSSALALASIVFRSISDHRHGPVAPAGDPGAPPRRRRLRDILWLNANPRLALLLFLFILPQQITSYGLVQYILPLQMGSQGFLQSDIARILLVYALVSAVAPRFQTGIFSMSQERVYLMVGNVILGLGLWYVAFNGEVWVLMICLVTSVLGSLIIDEVVWSFIRKHRLSRGMSEDKLVEFHARIHNLSIVVVPLIIIICLSMTGFAQTMAIIGTCAFAAALASAFIEDRSAEEEELP